MSRFIQVLEFEKYRHYRDRKAPWAKIGFELLGDFRLPDLSDSERWLIVGLLILANKFDNLIPYKLTWIQKELALRKPISLEKLIDTGWVILLEQDASATLADSSMLADGYQDSSNLLVTRASARSLSLKERNQEPKTQTQNSKSEPETPAATYVGYGEFGRAKLTDEQHGKLKQRLGDHLAHYIERFDFWVNEAPKARANGSRREERHAYETILNWYNRDLKEGKIRPTALAVTGPLPFKCAL